MAKESVTALHVSLWFKWHARSSLHLILM